MSSGKALVAAVVFAAIAAFAAAYARWTLYPRTLAQLAAIYKLPGSQFAEIDGLQVHYTEDGDKTSPCLVLLQGDFMNLRVWDDTVATLKSAFRIVRVDLLTQGLTGRDPDNDYSGAHNQRIVEGLLERLNLPRCSFVGSTDGGAVAYRFAAAHPDRVDRLILIDSAGAPQVDDVRPPDPSPYEWLASKLHFSNYWADLLYRDFGVMPPTRELTQMYYDMNRRAGIDEEWQLLADGRLPNDAERVLPRITAPTLLIWGTADAVTPSVGADAFARWLTQAPSLIRKYPHAGRYPFVECPKQVTRDMLEFLGGAHEGEGQKR